MGSCSSLRGGRLAIAAQRSIHAHKCQYASQQNTGNAAGPMQKV